MNRLSFDTKIINSLQNVSNEEELKTAIETHLPPTINPIIVYSEEIHRVLNYSNTLSIKNIKKLNDDPSNQDEIKIVKAALEITYHFLTSEVGKAICQVDQPTLTKLEEKIKKIQNAFNEEELKTAIEIHLPSTINPIIVYQQEIYRVLNYSNTLSIKNIKKLNDDPSNQDEIKIVKTALEITYHFLTSEVGKAICQVDQSTLTKLEKKIKKIQNAFCVPFPELKNDPHSISFQNPPVEHLSLGEEFTIPPSVSLDDQTFVDSFQEPPKEFLSFGEEFNMPSPSLINEKEIQNKWKGHFPDGSIPQKMKEMVETLNQENQFEQNTKNLDILFNKYRKYPEIINIVHKITMNDNKLHSTNSRSVVFDNLINLLEKIETPLFIQFLRSYSDYKTIGLRIIDLNAIKNKKELITLIEIISEQEQLIFSLHDILTLFREKIEFKNLFLENPDFRRNFLQTLTSFSGSEDLPLDLARKYSSFSSTAFFQKSYSKEDYQEIFSLAPGKREAVLVLLSEIKESTPSLSLHTRLLKIKSRSPSTVNGMINLIEIGQIDLVKKLLEMAEQGSFELASQLIDMSKTGAIEEVEELTKRYVDRKEDALNTCLLALANSQNSHQIQAILQIEKDQSCPKLLDLIRKEGLNSLTQNLLLLVTSNRIAFAEKMTNAHDQHQSPELSFSVEKFLLHLVSEGEIEIAHSINEESAHQLFLDWLNLIPELKRTIAVIRQLYMIERDLIAINPKLDERKMIKIQKEIKEVITKGINSNELEHSLSKIQLCLIEENTNKIKNNLDLKKILNIRLHHFLINRPKDPSFSHIPISDYFLKTFLSPSGEISPNLIEILKETNSYKNFMKQLEIEDREQIEFILDLFCKNSNLSVRLEELTLPKNNSKISKLIKTHLGFNDKQEITRNSLNRVIISGLMTPTRQEKIGSCFATSYVIRQEKDPVGVSQIVEDFISLINNESLVRYETIDLYYIPNYYQLLDDNLNMPELNRDHLLNRAREFTISSMGSGTTKKQMFELNLRLYENKDFKQTIELKVEELIQKSLINANSEELLAEINKYISEWWDQNVHLIYLTNMRSKTHLGGWILSKKQKGVVEPLIDSHEKLIALHQQCLNEVSEILSQKFHLNKNNFQEILQQELIKMRENSSFEDEELRTITLGGNASAFTYIYENRNPGPLHISAFSSHKDLLYELHQFNENLPSNIQDKIKENNYFRLPIGMPGHALSYYPHAVQSLISRLKNPNNLMEEFDRENLNFLNNKLSETMVSGIIDAFVPALKENSVLNPQFWTKTKITRLKSSTTINEIFMSIQGEAESCGLNKDSALFLEIARQVIISQTGNRLPKRLPKSLIFMDSNYKKNPYFGFTFSTPFSKMKVHQIERDGRPASVISLPEKEFLWKFNYFFNTPNPFKINRAQPK